MKRWILTLAAAAVAGAAWGGNCPVQMKAIDEALPKAKLDTAKAAEVKKLRAEGEQLHKAGKHGESMAALAKAKGILGLK